MESKTTTSTAILSLDDVKERLENFIEHNDIGTIFPENFFTSVLYHLNEEYKHGHKVVFIDGYSK